MKVSIVPCPVPSPPPAVVIEFTLSEAREFYKEFGKSTGGFAMARLYDALRLHPAIAGGQE